MSERDNGAFLIPSSHMSMFIQVGLNYADFKCCLWCGSLPIKPPYEFLFFLTQPSFVSEVGAPGRSALDSVEVAYGRQVSALHIHLYDSVLKYFNLNIC